MACFHPKKAWQTDNGDIVFSERGNLKKQLMLPCSQCIGCRLDRSKQWAIRCLHEAQMHNENCFITLTYNNTNITNDLIYPHFQKFIRKLRKKTGQKIRYYMAGEYGENTGRPHFHACLFGYRPNDLKIFRELPNGSRLYTSEFLETLWGYGFTSVGDVTLESASYVARYIMKKITGPMAENRYWSVNPATGEAHPITPEFNRMSLKPGIGQTWFDLYQADVYPTGQCIINGRKMKPPRYYETKYKELKPLRYEELQYDRYLTSNPAESHPDRLAVRETVTKARFNLKQRHL